MWRIRKDGGLAHPGEGQEDEGALVVNAIPTVVIRLAVVTVATWLAITVLALVIPSPLEEAANPLLTPNPAKAPWYFLWLQEIVADTTVRLGPLTINGALVGGVILPAVLLVVTTLWPWLDRSPASTVGVWMPRERRTQLLVFGALVVLVVGLTVVGLLRGPSWHFYWPWQPWPDLPSRF
jgi:quinol-cytochrome oxidoreductase complex cytochrome b subunit